MAPRLVADPAAPDQTCGVATPQLPGWYRWAGLALLVVLIGPIAWAVGGLFRDEVRDAAVYAVTVDGRRVAMELEACNPEEIDVDVDESPGQVVVAVRVTNPADGDGCAAIQTVVLDEPLGERPLVDATSGRTFTCGPGGVEAGLGSCSVEG
jgi:hypothetical protein